MWTIGEILLLAASFVVGWIAADIVQWYLGRP